MSTRDTQTLLAFSAVDRVGQHQVLGLKQKNSSVVHSVQIVQGEDSTTESDRWEVEFGEVQLVMDRETEGPVSLTIIGKQYGLLLCALDFLIRHYFS